MPAERRFHITQLVNEGREELAQLQGVRSGTTVEVGSTLLEHLRRSAELLGQALVHTAVAAWLEEAAAWSGLTAQELAG
ncbi:hypothetical protein QFZ66_000289 [Streptomyces sp. B4I13]|uniref:hypothetical protein n=1 Tax=Streptomyces sp. B4I13 TaxID=3042271 RepID=UPI00278152F6|nr:hypothetical protein [Streptomyces sp. B4I13]MDQ0956411.1 hypothetical protein [Streptomyces sp. B4I13]